MRYEIRDMTRRKREKGEEGKERNPDGRGRETGGDNVVPMGGGRIWEGRGGRRNGRRRLRPRRGEGGSGRQAGGTRANGLVGLKRSSAERLVDGQRTSQWPGQWSGRGAQRNGWLRQAGPHATAGCTANWIRTALIDALSARWRSSHRPLEPEREAGSGVVRWAPAPGLGWAALCWLCLCCNALQCAAGRVVQ